MKLSNNDRHTILYAIKEAEMKTSSEITPAIFSRSDEYRAANDFLALFFGMLPIFVVMIGNVQIELKVLAMIQIAATAAGWFLGDLPFIKRLVAGKSTMQKEVEERALTFFHSNNLHNTPDKTGILIYVSLLERQAIIVADNGIDERVPLGYWEEHLNIFLQTMKKGEIAKSMHDLILRLGGKLAENFPANELKNKTPDRLLTDL